MSAAIKQRPLSTCTHSPPATPAPSAPCTSTTPLTYLDEVVTSAYEGDFDRIYVDEALLFLGHNDYAAVSAHADDWEYLGTEGYAVAAE